MSDVDYDEVQAALREQAKIKAALQGYGFEYLDEADQAIDQLRARVAELEAENKWHLMDTLPEPGSRVLLYYPEYNGHIEDATVYDDGDGRYAVLFDGDMLSTEPTHWKPYPRMALNSEGDA